MPTIKTITLYAFEELSDEAQEEKLSTHGEDDIIGHWCR